jgi:hypothetical protein
MNGSITALRGEYLDTKAFRFSRNQRDAGIEHLEWEGRIKPLRPLFHDFAFGLGALVAAGIAIALI